MPTLAEWLASLGLERYAERFAQERIELDVLAELTEADLEKLGVALGDRKRLLKAVRGDAAPAPRVELRQVTILFVDLSGYTQLTSALGAEATHRLVQRFYALVNDIVRSHGGSVERHIGDAVMAVFGLPVAHDNDPERALRTAQAIHAAMPALGAEVGRPISVHAGIASGQVVASRTAESADFATVGDAVNLAARLVGLAEAGGTVLSDAVHRAAGRLVAAEPIGEVAVKGFERPVHAWRVRAWHAARGARPALVGRDAELERFRALCSACCAQRRGALVLVRGEAGIGKTRLIEAFAALAAELGFAAHTALILDFGAGRAQDPIGRLVCSVLTTHAQVDSDAREQALQAARREGLLLEDERMCAADLLDLPVPEALLPTYDALDDATRERRRNDLVVELVRRAAARRPQLLMVEDLHWAAMPTLQTLAALAQGIDAHPIIVVLTTRQRDTPALAGRGPVPLTLDLQPLPESAARSLARSLALLREAVPDEYIQRAGGNPLFLEQLLRNAAAGDQEALPGSIQSIVLARLDRLQARDRMALQAASVLGQMFSLAQLRHLIADPDYRCDALAAEHLVRELGEEYLFAHALVWEGTYLSLLTEQKRGWHAQAAAWFSGRDALLTAEHLDRAADPGAAAAYLAAAREELAAHRPERALRALERGAEVAREDAERASLLTDLAQLQLAIGRPQDALENFQRLMALIPGGVLHARAHIGVANALRLLDRRDEALLALDEAERAAPAALDHADRARIHYLRGSLFFPRGEVQAGLAEQTRALEHARAAGSIELQLRALSGLGDAHYAGGRVVSAYRDFKECVELSRAQRIVQVEAANLPMLAICGYWVTRIEESLEQARAALELARRIASPRSELIAHHAGCILALQSAELAAALAHAQASLQVAQAIGARRFVPESMMFIAICLGEQGARDDARGLLLEALELSREHISYCGPWILGCLLRYADDDAQRSAWLREGEAVLDAGGPAHNIFGFYSNAIEAALETGQWDVALRYCDRFEAHFRVEPAPLCDFEVARGRALARFGRGERGSDLREALRRLVAQARGAGLRAGLRALEAASERMPAEPSRA